MRRTGPWWIGPTPGRCAICWPEWIEVARQQRAVFLKIEPGFGLDDVDFAGYGFRRSAQTVQPPRTVVLDLSGDDEAILARMNQGTRRNIRKSIKNDIEIREGTRDDVQHLTLCWLKPATRDEFGVHTPRYYERAYDLFVPSGRAALILGRYADQDLAGVMVFALGDSAWYLYGASSDRERQRMASYGAQWAGIQWAKAHGATGYDMYGVPDEDPASLEASSRHAAMAYGACTVSSAAGAAPCGAA